MFKRFLPILATLAICPALPAQDEDAEEKKIPEWQLRLENLAPEKRMEYAKTLEEGGRFFNQKRVFEALNKVYEAEEIFDGNPGALNLKGACYVEFRDFERARVCFEKAISLSPKNPNVLFNLVEMEFVTKQWEDCESRIQELLPLVDEKNIPMRRLLEFKLLLAHLKTDKVDQAKALSEKYDFLDDNPFYYYANAAMDYHAGETEKAERWIASARRVFRNPSTIAPWQDTLIEFGYIKSFYGEDLEVKPVAE